MRGAVGCDGDGLGEGRAPLVRIGGAHAVVVEEAVREQPVDVEVGFAGGRLRLSGAWARCRATLRKRASRGWRATVRSASRRSAAMAGPAPSRSHHCRPPASSRIEPARAASPASAACRMASTVAPRRASARAMRRSSRRAWAGVPARAPRRPCSRSGGCSRYTGRGRARPGSRVRRGPAARRRGRTRPASRAPRRRGRGDPVEERKVEGQPPVGVRKRAPEAARDPVADGVAHGSVR